MPRTKLYAFLTSMRTKQYVPAAKSLACSLAKTNPHSHLIVLGAEGDNLTAGYIESLRFESRQGLTVEYVVVPDLAFPSYT